MYRGAVAILSTQNLIHNVQTIRNQVASAKIIAMVKANAYGHGLRSVSERIAQYVDMFGVACIEEAQALRKIGINTPILLTEGVFSPQELLLASIENFHVVFHDRAQLDWLKKISTIVPIEAWLKIDTGMGRLGFNPEEGKDAYDSLVENKLIAKNVRVMSHFACADHKEHPKNLEQINAFKSFIQGRGHIFSFCNTPAIFNFFDQHYNYVRPGIALYGASPFKNISAEALNLKPVMTLQSNLIAVKSMQKGATIGYGGTYECPENMPIGVIAFGYGDGYPRSAKSGTPILVNQKLCQIVGRVSMDMMTVDLRNAPDAKVGDPVVLWGETLPVERIAEFTDKIPYDILTGVQHRVKFLWTKLK